MAPLTGKVIIFDQNWGLLGADMVQRREEFGSHQASHTLWKQV